MLDPLLRTRLTELTRVRHPSSRRDGLGLRAAAGDGHRHAGGLGILVSATMTDDGWSARSSR